jgi:hypothetical protein
MLSGTIWLQCLIALRPPPTESEIDKIVQSAVAQFLNDCLIARLTD